MHYFLLKVSKYKGRSHRNNATMVKQENKTQRSKIKVKALNHFTEGYAAFTVLKIKE